MIDLADYVAEDDSGLLAMQSVTAKRPAPTEYKKWFSEILSVDEAKVMWVDGCYLCDEKQVIATRADITGILRVARLWEGE